MQNQKRSKLNEITTIVLLCRDQLKITTDRIMNQQSQQPTATGAGAQSTSVPSQSVDFASPRPAGKISRFQELSMLRKVRKYPKQILVSSILLKNDQRDSSLRV